MSQEIVRNVPLRSSLLKRREITARPSGRLRRAMAAAAVEAVPELLQKRPAQSEVTEGEVQAPAQEAVLAPPAPFSGSVPVGSVAELLNVATQLATSGNPPTSQVVAQIVNERIVSLDVVVPTPTESEPVHQITDVGTDLAGPQIGLA